MESDTNLCRSIRNIMKDGGLEVYSIKSADTAFHTFGEHNYCLIILDFQKLDVNDMKVISMIRTESSVPILVMADILHPDQKIELFHAGAHAYIEKPANADECVAQAYALMRLYGGRVIYKQQDELIFRSGLVIKPHFRQAFVEGKLLELTRKEFDLLYFLAGNPGQVFNYEQLYLHVWKDNYTFCEDKTVKVHIGTLRRKLKALQKDYIKNVWGIGYKFVSIEDTVNT